MNTRIFYWASLSLLIVGLVIHVLTFIPGIPTGGLLTIFVLMTGMFITIIPSIKRYGVLAREVGMQNVQGEVTRHLPRWMRMTFLGLLFYTAFNFLFTLGYLTRGLSPAIRDGAFVLEEHGHVVRTITAEEYERQGRYQVRGFATHPMLFEFVSAMILWSCARRMNMWVTPPTASPSRTTS